jgi:peptide deformylase
MKPSIPVDFKALNGEGLETLVNRMIDHMYLHKGLGLAAPQIGVALRMFVYDSQGDPIVVINPHVVSMEGKQKLGEEGCLSVINFSAKVPRYESIVITAQNMDGQEFGLHALDMTARVVQHELDHLDGKLILDHVTALRRKMYKKKITKHLKRRGANDMSSVWISHPAEKSEQKETS